VEVSFIGGGSRSFRRKLPTFRKSLTVFVKGGDVIVCTVIGGDVIVYSYLMGVDAIDQTICPEVLGMTTPIK
jgi:hypothetical protein